MMTKQVILGNIINLTILILVALGNGAVAMSSNHSNSTTKFRQIEQPLELKVMVTLGGLGLMGLELWWFLGSQPTTPKADSHQKIEESTILNRHNRK